MPKQAFEVAKCRRGAPNRCVCRGRTEERCGGERKSIALGIAMEYWVVLCVKVGVRLLLILVWGNDSGQTPSALSS